MLEGKKISELETVTQLQNACCFPVLTNGETKRITFGSLLSQIENDLPESEIEQVKENVETLKTRADESSVKINDLKIDVDNLKNEFDIVDEMVQGQNATINNCVSTVNELEQIINETHFDDVLELEEQVRANAANIERKQGTLSAVQMQAVNSGITAEKVAQYDAGTSLDAIFDMCHPVGEVYVQFPTQTEPNALYGRGTWTEITEDYAGLFFRAAGGNAAEFGETQEEGLPNAVGKFSTVYTSVSAKVSGIVKSIKGQTGRFSTGSAGSIEDLEIDLSRNGADPIYGNSEHVTPINTAIKIWKRTA